MTQRGQRVATRAPSGDPWGYYGQQDTAPELQEARPEPSHMPDTRPSRTESSTEVMNTDEGQRTSAKLLEEAQRLSEEAYTYLTIEEHQKVGSRGSDATISDIWSTQDPDTEFRARHGIRSEEISRPWHNRRSSVASDLH